MTADLTRRQWIGTLGTTAAAVTGGCLDQTEASSSANGNDEITVAASFFVLGDLAASVAGDVATVETLVPVGQHGHGWQPGPDVMARAIEADVFVYMAQGFQPWADDVVENVRDGDSETVLVEARQGVDLLPAPGDGHSHEGDHDHGTSEDDHDGHEIETDHDEHQNEIHDDDHQNEHQSEEHDSHSEAGGDHEAVDPHFWLDPRRAATAVETISERLAAIDEANANHYTDAAASTRERLLELDARFESTLANASRGTVLVAGHNAFQYLGKRYGFDIVSLTGLSPDDSPTSDDLRRAQAVVEEHGLDHVLAPVMESDRAAEGIVADTAAETVLPVTALPGRHESWVENEWGYEQIMTEVNLATLEAALDA